MLGVLLAASSILLLVLLSHRFVKYLAEAVAGEVSARSVLTLLALQVPIQLGILLPLGLLLAVLIVFARLRRENEMAILAAAGVGTGRLLLALAWVAVPLTAVVAALSLLWSPWALEREQLIREREAETAGLRSIAAGRFNELAENRGVYYVESIAEEGTRLRQVFAAAQKPIGSGRETVTGVVSARSAYLWTDERNGERYLLLLDGTRYEGEPGEADFRMVRYAKHGLRIGTPPSSSQRQRRRFTPTPTLWASADARDRAELQWRLSIPLATPVLTLLAVPLSGSGSQHGRFARILPGMLVYVSYANLLGVAKLWVEQERGLAVFGMWWVHALVLILALLLWPGRLGWRRHWQRLRAWARQGA
jgi:lipopolysaccharide export system permease protein